MSILPTSISHIEHIKVFDDIAADRLAAMPIEAVLVYLLDLVSAEALPVLAEQFDLMGVKGYQFATTEQAKRELIKNALELHRYKGTPWAIKEALSKIGIIVDWIEEGVGDRYLRDGTYRYNGTIRRGGDGHWAYFRVWINAGVITAVTAAQFADAVTIINEYKNVRSWLYDISIAINLDDTHTITDDEFELDMDLNDQLLPLHDGTYLRDGSIAYGSYDTLTVTPIASGFTPPDLPDLLAWFRPDNLSYVWESSSFTGTVNNGSTTVTASGGSGGWWVGNLISFDAGATFYRISAASGTTLTLSAAFVGTSGSYPIHWAKVGTWTDSSSFTRSATAPFNQRPFYIQNSLNGYPATYMTAPQFWSISPITSTSPPSFQLVAVIKHNALASSNVLLAHRSTANPLIQFSANANGAQGQFRDSTGGTVQSTTNTTSGTAGFNIIAWNFNQKASPALDFLEVWNNGDNANKTTAQANLSGNFNSTLQIIGGFNNGGFTQGYAGDIVEMVIFADSGLGDFQKVEGYLAWKYGLTGNLPSGHPYKTTQPTN